HCSYSSVPMTCVDGERTITDAENSWNSNTTMIAAATPVPVRTSGAVMRVSVRNPDAPHVRDASAYSLPTAIIAESWGRTACGIIRVTYESTRNVGGPYRLNG